jgi:hypothetical protein
MMTDRLVRPIRAWADYDEWSVFAIQSATEIGGFRSDGWQRWDIPKAAKWQPSQYRVAYSLVDTLDFMDLGPLRSLRVLYENGWWLQLDPIRGGITTAISDWFWCLHQGTDDPEIPHGRFTEDKDSEAVERSMIAAAAWFTQADPATLGIDSPPPEPAS